MNNSSMELPGEDLRINALRRYQVLDTLKEEAFDRVTRLAATYLRVPVVIISLVDEDRIWFKSTYGLELKQICREAGLCASAILTDGPYLVEDAAADSRTLANPWVAGNFGLKFYAAFPLKTYDGHNIGALCAIDKRPRKLTREEVVVLEDLRDNTMELLELRLAARTAASLQRNLLNRTLHDLKNPLANISIRAQLIESTKDNPAVVSEFAMQIKKTSSQMISQVDNLLVCSGPEASGQQPHYKPVDLQTVLEQVVFASSPLAANKGQQIKMNLQGHPKVLGEELQLVEIFDNLISNAIKYTYPGGLIKVKLHQSGENAIISISDNGPGFTQADHQNMFHQFARLSAKPTGEESSSGLGLFIVRQLVKQHRGNIRAEKRPLSGGAHMIIELPVMVTDE